MRGGYGGSRGECGSGQGELRFGGDYRRGRQVNTRAARLLNAGGKCELPALDGGVDPATGALAVGGRQGG